MTSQRVERTWIRTGGYGRFRGEWVNGLNKKNRKAFQISLQPDWQIDKSIFNNTGGVPEQRLQHWLTDRLSPKVYQKKPHFEVKVKQCNKRNGPVLQTYYS